MLNGTQHTARKKDKLHTVWTEGSTRCSTDFAESDKWISSFIFHSKKIGMGHSVCILTRNVFSVAKGLFRELFATKLFNFIVNYLELLSLCPHFYPRGHIPL